MLAQDKPVTPINKEVLERKLHGYDVDKSKILIKGFAVGFRLGFAGLQEIRMAKNLKSAFEHPKVVQEKIDLELRSGRVAGPFKNIPLNNCCVNQLA